MADRDPLVVVLALAGLLFAAATGFCVFDTDGHDHDGVGLDLCIAMLAVTFGVALSVALCVVGTTTERLGWAATPAAVSVLDPPPWR